MKNTTSEYHFVLTLQCSDRGGIHTVSLDGIYIPTPGQTRRDVYLSLVDEVRNKYRIPSEVKCVPLLFELRLNKLE